MPDPIGISSDDLWPREPTYRYRLYARRGQELDCLAAAPTMGAVGVAIQRIHQDCKIVGKRLADLGVIGILDTLPEGEEAPNGEWIVLPWERGKEMTVAEAFAFYENPAHLEPAPGPPKRHRRCAPKPDLHGDG